MAHELEIEELRQLQEIIGRHEDQAFKNRGWMYALLGALTAAFFKEGHLMRYGPYISISLLVSVLFLFTELMHRGFARLAIRRSEVVQIHLRKGNKYDGPLVSESMAAFSYFRAVIGEIYLPTVWVHYIGLWLIIGLIARVSR
jgi:hypothetical protein